MELKFIRNKDGSINKIYKVNKNKKIIKLFKILKLIIDDKKLGIKGRNKRQEVLNFLLFLKKPETKLIMTSNKNTYELSYTYSRFKYDDEPITLKNIFNKIGLYRAYFKYYISDRNNCVLDYSNFNCKFTKRKMYKWFKAKVEEYDNIFSRIIL